MVDMRHFHMFAGGALKQYSRWPPKMTARSILIVENDEGLGETLFEQLSRYEEFRILRVSSASNGIRIARGRVIDLVIIDTGLPDLDGREMVKILRKDDFRAPIILLTITSSDADTILGLEAGASDCVTRPFRFAALLARIRAHLRQYDQRAAD